MFRNAMLTVMGIKLMEAEVLHLPHIGARRIERGTYSAYSESVPLVPSLRVHFAVSSHCVYVKGKCRPKVPDGQHSCTRAQTIIMRRQGAVLISASMVLSRQWACARPCYGR